LGFRVEGKKKFECQITVRNGKVVYDLNGLTTPLNIPKN